MEPVTCTCTYAVFDVVRCNQLDQKSFIYETDVNIAFFYMARTRKTLHSDGVNDKLKSATCSLLIRKSFVTLCH